MALRSQNATSSAGRRGRRYSPGAFNAWRGRRIPAHRAARSCRGAAGVVRQHGASRWRTQAESKSSADLASRLRSSWPVGFVQHALPPAPDWVGQAMIRLSARIMTPPANFRVCKSRFHREAAGKLGGRRAKRCHVSGVRSEQHPHEEAACLHVVVLAGRESVRIIPASARSQDRKRKSAG